MSSGSGADFWRIRVNPVISQPCDKLNQHYKKLAYFEGGNDIPKDVSCEKILNTLWHRLGTNPKRLFLNNHHVTGRQTVLVT